MFKEIMRYLQHSTVFCSIRKILILFKKSHEACVFYQTVFFTICLETNRRASETAERRMWAIFFDGPLRPDSYDFLSKCRTKSNEFWYRVRGFLDASSRPCIPRGNTTLHPTCVQRWGNFRAPLRSQMRCRKFATAPLSFYKYVSVCPTSSGALKRWRHRQNQWEYSLRAT